MKPAWMLRLIDTETASFGVEGAVQILYLDEITRHDGRGDSRQNLKCPDCIAWNLEEGAQGEPEIHCKDCFLNDLVCMSCCVSRHRQNPFHCIEVRFFSIVRMFRADFPLSDGQVFTSLQRC